jgi:hypothetical protein
MIKNDQIRKYFFFETFKYILKINACGGKIRPKNKRTKCVVCVWALSTINQKNYQHHPTITNNKKQ